MSEKLYRVVRRWTHSYQPGGGTFWDQDVLYCGYDRDQAREVYHRESLDDVWRGPGNKVIETRSEVITDAGTDDFEDDVIEKSA